MSWCSVSHTRQFVGCELKRADRIPQGLEPTRALAKDESVCQRVSRDIRSALDAYSTKDGSN